ncbi:hypothetical protein GCM10027402_26660 [Arthrobacter monumenti]
MTPRLLLAGSRLRNTERARDPIISMLTAYVGAEDMRNEVSPLTGTRAGRNVTFETTKQPY